MNNSAQCPRCQQPFQASSEDSVGTNCDSCRGVFVEASLVNDGTFADATEVTDSDAEALICPNCQSSMSELNIGGTLIDRCTGCGGVWLDAGEELNAQEPEAALATLGRYFVYSLTVPERTVRSTIGLAAGAAREAADFMVPQAFQSSKTYEVAIRNSLRFLIEDIGGVKGQQTDGAEGPDDYMARKTVGNFIDLAGIATLHVSPLWLLAIVSDMAYGSKTYLVELGEELKKQGLIDEDSTITQVDDVLEAIQHASGTAAGLFDTPPLSTDQLKETLDETRTAVKAAADYKKVLPEAELKRYWEEMREVAEREDVSLLGVSGAMTMHSLGKVKTVSQGALTGVMVAGGLFNRHVVGHYLDSLKNIHERGLYQTLHDSSAPYIEGVWSNFESNRPTITEDVVSGRAIGKIYDKLTGWLGGRPLPD